MKEKRSRLSRLMEYAGGRRYLTYASLVLSAISAALSVVPFYCIWRMLDEVLSVMPDYGEADGIVHFGWMALLFAVLSVLLYLAALMCSHLSAFRVAKNMKKALMEHIAEMPQGAFDTIGTGKIRRIVGDSVGSTEIYLAHQLPDAAGSIVLPIAILVLLLSFDWRLGLASLAPVAISVAAMMSMVSSKVMKGHMEVYQGALADVNKETVEYIRGISVIKTFQQTVESFQSLKGSISRYSEFTIEYTRWCRSRMCLFLVASNSAFASIAVVALAVNGGTIWTPEFMSDFLFYAIFTPLVAVLLMRVMFASNDGFIVDDALARVDSILSMESLEEPAEPMAPDGTDVVFENVTFAYPGSGTNAVEDFSMRLEPGTVTALVGPSGSGKSTIAGLACRFWDPQKGRIAVGGTDLRDIGSAGLGRLTTSVLQSNHLMKGTLRENVALGRSDATDEEVLSAMMKAQCTDIIAKMPDGLESRVGPGGVFLSGGEVQRIAIARAVLKDSPVVVLDEATAFADPENEVLVQRALGELSRGKTVLLIAHRLTTVRDADRICVLESGRMVESGTHDELIAADGVYRSMWDDYQRSLTWKVEGVKRCP